MKTLNAEFVANHDSEDNRTMMQLHRLPNGRYRLTTSRLQVRENGRWHTVPADGSAKGKDRENIRFSDTSEELTEVQALDWYVANVMPEELRQVIQKHLGELITANVPKAWEGPLDRYCAAHHVSRNEAAQRALTACLTGERAAKAELLEAEGIAALIQSLQASMARKYGTDVSTDAGAATLFVSHDGVSLTDGANRVVAMRASSASRALAKTIQG
jgi:hypothetical protein